MICFRPNSQNYEKISYFYISPWFRIGPHLIGMATAYFLVTMKQKWEAKKVNARFLINIIYNNNIEHVFVTGFLKITI